MSGPVPVISLRHLRKAFGATCALDDVSLDLYPGEVFALVGANGAGKSTLIKVLSGVYPDYEGEIAVGGVVERMRDPIEAQRRGILTVHQRIDEGLVPGLSTAENLTLDKLADGSTGAWYSIRRAEGDGREVARRMGLQLSRSALQADVRYLNVSDRQMVILARALSRFPRLLILDEPTAALSKVEADRLFQAVRLLKSRGVTVLYISHRLGEVEALADRIGVLRDGRLRALSTRPFSRTAIVETMLGKAVASEFEHKEQRGEEEVLRLEGVRIDSGSPPIDLSIYRGEVIGITGLIGAGKSELLYGLAGVRPYAAGRVLLQRRPIAPQHPFHAVRAGIYLVPEDRSSQALIPEWSVKANLSLPFLRGIARLGFIRSRAEQRRAGPSSASWGSSAPVLKPISPRSRVEISRRSSSPAGSGSVAASSCSMSLSAASTSGRGAISPKKSGSWHRSWPWSWPHPTWTRSWRWPTGSWSWPTGASSWTRASRPRIETGSSRQ